MALDTRLKGSPCFTWYLGDKTPPCDFWEVVDVVWVKADGDELGAILGTFDNLPMLRHDSYKANMATRAYHMMWFGDDAKFIIANLHLLKRT